MFAGAQTPVDGERLELSSARWEDVRAAGVILEVPDSSAATQSRVDAAAAEHSVRAQFVIPGDSVENAPTAKESKLAILRHAGSPANARLVWVVALDARPPVQGPAGPYVLDEGGFWLHFVDAVSGEVVGSVGANRISDEALEAEKNGTLPPWYEETSEKVAP
ncbi:MAG: hypothetical protein ACRDHF_04020 [Tepidiformaceae bacterium]